MLIAMSLFAAELKPYKISDLSCIKKLSDDIEVKMMGKEYNSGYFCNRDGYILFAPEDSFGNMEVTVGVGDAYKTDAVSTVEFFTDGKSVKKLSLNFESVPQKVIIPLAGRRQLKIVFDIEGSGSGIVLTNMNFK